MKKWLFAFERGIKMKQNDFINRYKTITPRPLLIITNDKIESYIYEYDLSEDKYHEVKVEVKLESDLSQFIAQISYASEDHGYSTALNNVGDNLLHLMEKREKGMLWTITHLKEMGDNMLRQLEKRRKETL